MWRLMAMPFIVLLPGHLVLQLAQGKAEDRRGLGEHLFLATLVGILLGGWLALILAQVGLFSLGRLLLALAACSLACLAYLLLRGMDPTAALRRAGIGWEEVAVALLLGLSLLLYARPAEYLPVFLDPGWYVNTGFHVARTGSLTGESQLFSALPLSARPLFFRSFRSFRTTMPQFPDVASSGFYLMAFAVADVTRGQIGPYHPPLFSAWIATFYALGGLRASLYTTPFFGVLSVLALYFAGKAVFGQGIGLLAAILMAFSFTQVYFSRTPFAEILTQFLLLGGLYALTMYVREGRPLLALVAGLALGQALLVKIESLIILVPLALFWGYWLWRERGAWRDLFFFVVPFSFLLAHAGLLALTVNRPYVVLNGHGLWLRLRSLVAGPTVWLGVAVPLLLAMGATWVILRLQRRRVGLGWVEGRWLKLSLSFLILLLAVYAYYLQPLAASAFRQTQALPQLGLFLSPLGVWLGVLGLVKLIHQGLEGRQAFFLTFATTFSLIVLAAPTVTTSLSHVYAIRRQVPAVIPSFLLLASYALLGWPCGMRRGKRRKGTKRGIPQGWEGRGALLRLAQGVAVVTLVVSFLALDRPFLGYGEMAGAVAFTERLADHFGGEDVVLFEAITGDSHVGRFAAPLWTLYDKQALLLSADDPPQEELASVVARWLGEGQQVYLVSQSRPASVTLERYKLVPRAEERWRSSTLAPNLNFPPETWEFEMPFHIYQIFR
ncbi:MAG: glycosyltransferase family 39 protein [Anaerolineae bacterium]